MTTNTHSVTLQNGDVLLVAERIRDGERNYFINLMTMGITSMDSILLSEDGFNSLAKIIYNIQHPPKRMGYCKAHQQPGGCPHHNLQCGYPKCDEWPKEPE